MGTVSAAEWTVGPTGNYQNIQSAVDGSSDNDTITVLPNGTGAYTENIVVNKTGLLIKASGTVTVQPDNPFNPVFLIDSKGINSTIMGFNIRSGGNDNNYNGIGLIQTSGATITGNNIINANQAVYSQGSNDITIEGNTISDSYSVGIHVYSPSTNIKVLNNILTGNREAIDWSTTSNSEISGNIIQNSGLNGILFINSQNNLISGNTITGTQIAPGNGWIGNGDAIFLSASTDNTISGNTLINNANSGIHIRYASNSNFITNNVISGSQTGIYLEQLFGLGNSDNTISENTINCSRGIYVELSNNNMISQNKINTTDNGIHFESSSYNTILKNAIVSTLGNGIYMYGSSYIDIMFNDIKALNNFGWLYGNGIALWGSSGNDIFSNNIQQSGTGIYSFQSAENIAHFNRIIASGDLLQNIDSGAFNATLNWWGSNNSPDSRITGNAANLVEYDPWLVMRYSADPVKIEQGKTSVLSADFRYDSKGDFHDPALGTIPDGIPVKFTTTLGNVGSKFTFSETLNGVATAILRGDEAAGAALTSATLDDQTLSTTVTITPRVNAASEISAADPDNTVGMQKTGLPLPAMVLAILMVLGGLFGFKRE